MRSDDLTPDPGSAAGQSRSRAGRAEFPRRIRGRLALLLGAAIGASWLPIEDRPPDDPPMQRARGRPGAAISHLAYSRDGRTLATIDGPGRVALRPAVADDVGERALVARGTAVAFAPGAGLLAVGGAGPDVIVCDPALGRERPLGLPVRAVSDLEFSPDGRTLAVSSSCRGEVLLWDLAAGRPRMALRGPCDRVSMLAFAPDGRTLAAVGLPASAVLIWDPDSGRLRRRLAVPAVVALAYSPDGRALATISGEETTVRLRDARMGDPIGSIADRAVPLVAMAFSPGGRLLATAAGDATVGLWDLATGRELRRLDGRAHLLGTVAFAPDGRTLAAAGYDDAIRLWDLGELLRGGDGPPPSPPASRW